MLTVSKIEPSLESIDLQLAKQRLNSNALSLSIVKNDLVLFESDDHGVQSLIEAIQKCGPAMYGASVADRVVGRAAALLFLYSKVAWIYAGTLSKNAAELLARNRIQVQYETLVPRILNRSGTDVCPFEKAVTDIGDPEIAYEILKTFKPFK